MKIYESNSKVSVNLTEKMADINKTTLIINYLPQTLTDVEFQTMFASIGAVKSCKIVRERGTGYSYGFGFVEYMSEIDAANAIQALNGVQLQNKVIKVAYSRQGGRIKGANLYIRGLPTSCTAIELEQLFSPYGEIVQSRVLTDNATGLSRGVGFVLFATRDEAETALAGLHNTTPAGFPNPLQVQFAEDKTKNREVKRPIVAGNPAPPPAQIPPQILGGYPMGTYPNFGMGYGLPQPGGGNLQGPMRNQMTKHHRYNPMAAQSYGVGVQMPAMAPQPAHMMGDGVGPAGHVLFAYNIGPDTTEAQLCQLFAAYGTVTKTDVIRDQSTGVGKGFGFVTMPNYPEALTAIQSLNGYCYTSKPMQVSFKSAKSGKKA